MLSILIPVYNTSIYNLVFSILEMAESEEMTYELCVADDASTNFQTLAENSFLKNLENCTYTIFETNQGRTATSEFLAKQAKYNYLLFLDADVMPLNTDFLTKINSNAINAEVIFGGITYAVNKPESEEMLRWVYGKKRETRSLKQRQLKPYLSLTPAALFCTKDIYLTLKIPLENRYGFDILLSYKLQELNVQVLHIQNPVIHLGLETSMRYLQKTRAGLDTLFYLQKTNLISKNYRPIQRVALRMQKLGLAKIYISVFKYFENKVIQNICSDNPSTKLFDAYRLYYYLKIQKKNA